MNTHTVLSAYQNVKIESGINGASSHQLIVMLLEGAMDKLTMATRAISEGNIGDKGQQISGVISIVDNLRASVDLAQGGEIALNLVALYDYMENRLLEANLNSDASIVDEVKSLLKAVYQAWTEIPEELRDQ